MRWMISLLCISLTFSLEAKFKIAWIGDTTVVYRTILEGDTLYSWRSGKVGVDARIYYDKGYTKLAAHEVITKSSRCDTNWHSNGQIKHISYRNCSACMGCSQEEGWYADGKLKKLSTISTDSCESTYFYHNGRPRKIYKYVIDTSTVTGRVWVYELEFYENGQRKSDSYNPNGPPQLICYYNEDGSRYSRTTLTKHEMSGVFEVWYPDEQLKVKGEHSPDTTGLFPTPIGTWSYYSESGKLIKEEFYEEGKLVKTIEY